MAKRGKNHLKITIPSNLRRVFRYFIENQNKSDEITRVNTEVAKKNTYVGKLGIIVSLICMVISSGFSIQSYLSNSVLNKEKERTDSINTLVSKIKEEFNPDKVCDRIDIMRYPDVNALYNFQSSVLDLIRLREPHQKVHFGRKIEEVYQQVKLNIKNRYKYDSRLDSIIQLTYYVDEKDTEFDNSLDYSNQRLINRINIDENEQLLIKFFSQRIRYWNQTDSDRNEQVLSAISIHKNSTMIDDINKAIFPLIDFGKSDMNYSFRIDFYDFLLDLNVIYLEEVNKRYHTHF